MNEINILLILDRLIYIFNLVISSKIQYKFQPKYYETAAKNCKYDELIYQFINLVELVVVVF